MTPRFLIRETTKLDSPLFSARIVSSVSGVKRIKEACNKIGIYRSLFSGNVSHFSIKNDFIKQLDWNISQEEIFADSKVEVLHYGSPR